MKTKSIALQMSFHDNDEMLRTYIMCNLLKQMVKMRWLVMSKLRYHQMCGSLMDYDAIY